MIEIAKASPLEVAFFYFGGDQIVLRIDRRAVALGTVREMDGRAWGMLDVTADASRHIIPLVRAVKRYLREGARPMYVVCGQPKAGRLLTLLGFVPTDEQVLGGTKRVWLWRPRMV